MKNKIIAILLSASFVHPLFATLSGSNTDLGGTTQGSSQNSSAGTSSDTNVTTTIVVIGAVILAVGIPLSIVSTTVKSQQKSAKRLVIFMNNNHNELIHDVAHGSGTLLSQIAYDLGLNRDEVGLIEKRLAGSVEQREILGALNGEIDEDDAVVFSKNFSSIFLKVLGRERIDSILKKSWGEAP